MYILSFMLGKQFQMHPLEQIESNQNWKQIKHINSQLSPQVQFLFNLSDTVSQTN